MNGLKYSLDDGVKLTSFNNRMVFSISLRFGGVRARPRTAFG
jgi:hypothetical protein